MWAEVFNAYFGLHDKDRVAYRLLCRYRQRLSPRLTERLRELNAVAAENTKKLFEEAMKKKGSFLDKVKKEPAWTGGTLEVPFAT